MATLYALKHKSGRYYVAASMSWQRRKALVPRLFERAMMPKAVLALSPRADDWQLVVIRHITDIDKHKLARVRDALIVKLIRAGQPVLNDTPLPLPRTTYLARLRRGVDPAQAAIPATPSSRSRLAIVDGTTRLTFREAARQLGCLPQTLAKRLQNVRRHDPQRTSITFKELWERSKRARAYWK